MHHDITSPETLSFKDEHCKDNTLSLRFQTIVQIMCKIIYKTFCKLNNFIRWTMFIKRLLFNIV